VEPFLRNFREAISIARSSMTRDTIPHGQVNAHSYPFSFVRVFLIAIKFDCRAVLCSISTLGCRPGGMLCKPHNRMWRGCKQKWPTQRRGIARSPPFEPRPSVSRTRQRASARGAMRHTATLNDSMGRGPDSNKTSVRRTRGPRKSSRPCGRRTLVWRSRPRTFGGSGRCLEAGVGILKPKTEPKLNPNRPNCRSIRVFGFGFGSYMCYISGYGFEFDS
jgi:hypothetical protein